MTQADTTHSLYISYGLPILIGLIHAKRFNSIKGPFNLGPFSRIVAFIACAWIACITVVFCLPTANPVNKETLNYTVVAVGIIAIVSLGVWVLSARKWFVGPKKEVAALSQGVNVDNLGPEELEALEQKERNEGAKKE